MLDRISNSCDQLKMYFIQLGFPIAPPTVLETNKLKQIDTGLKHICEGIFGTSNTLYQNAMILYSQCTGRFYKVTNIQHLSTLLTLLCAYLKRYLS